MTKFTDEEPAESAEVEGFEVQCAEFDREAYETERDDALRERALFAANMYAAHRSDFSAPADVCDRAEAFYRFLKGQSYGTVQ